MQRKIVGLAIGLLAVVSAFARAQEAKPVPAAVTPGDGRLTAGEYVEIDAEGRANRDLLLLVQEVSPNIIHLRGKNGWVAFASYNAGRKEYRGFFEWPDLPGIGRPAGKWADLYQIRVTVQGGVLRIEGKSAANELLIRAKSRAEGQGRKPAHTSPVSKVKRSVAAEARQARARTAFNQDRTCESRLREVCSGCERSSSI